MKLKKKLQDAGFDLIDSPIRNHKPLQVWLKKGNNELELAYEHIDHGFSSEVPLSIQTDNALSVDYQNVESYKFNIGLTILEKLLSSLGMGNLGLSAKFSGGKSVSMSYDSSQSLIIPIGEVMNYLGSADFKYPNPVLLRNANRENLILISGVLMAKDIKATLESNSDISAELEAELSNAAEGKMNFTRSSANKLEMVSEGNAAFPIAVKANRIKYHKGEFRDIELISDNRNFF